MKESICFVALSVLFISTICIYSARGIIKKRINKVDENKVVFGMKIVGFIFSVISLVIICYLK